MDINEALRWRYATKRMNGQAVHLGNITKIIDAAHLAPSGIGLQPYEIIIITNRDLKQKIHAIAFGQKQVVECSHLLVFAAWEKYSRERIDQVFDYLSNERNIPISETMGQRLFAIDYFSQMSVEDNFHHAAKQAHIALGIAIAACATLGIDATPMEGFDKTALDQLLHLKVKSIKSSMLLAIGYRDEENDWNLKLKKIRKPLREFVTFVD